MTCSTDDKKVPTSRREFCMFFVSPNFSLPSRKPIRENFLFSSEIFETTMKHLFLSCGAVFSWLPLGVASYHLYAPMNQERISGNSAANFPHCREHSGKRARPANRPTPTERERESKKSKGGQTKSFRERDNNYKAWEPALELLVMCFLHFICLSRIPCATS